MDSSERALRIVLVAAGLVPIATGLYGIATGTEGIVGEDGAGASVDSELRFAYVFWIAYGVAWLRVAPHAKTETAMVRALAAILFAAGLARGVAWAAAGRPHTALIVLMAVELVLPPIVVAWQARVAEAAR